jgi:hypothetical protein
MKYSKEPSDPVRFTARANRAYSAFARAYDRSGDPKVVATDIAFHMTDWLEDLERWDSFCREPEALPKTEINKLLIEFLVHVPNHLAAASKLHLGWPVSDVFEIGALEQDEDHESA